jgi:enoyl-[acyl-carrier protein] reductase I
VTGPSSEAGSTEGAPRAHALLLEGKSFVVTGAANSRSIAWAVAQAVKRHGGAVALTYQADRLKRRVQQLADELGGAPMIELDVSSDTAVRRAVDELAEQMPVLDGLVHSIAWAPAEDLQGNFVETTRDGFAQANDISSYSLIATAREARRPARRPAAARVAAGGPPGR